MILLCKKRYLSESIKFYYMYILIVQSMLHRNPPNVWIEIIQSVI